MNARALAGASAISAASLAAGDAACQALQRRRAGAAAPPAPHDWARTARFAATGALLHGPFFYAGFRWLDASIPGRTAGRVALKAVVGQCTLFPTYTAAAMALLAVLDGASRGEVGARLGAGYGRALVSGTLYWPVVNAVNFALLPPSGYSRLLAVNAAALAWNGYLSLVTDDAARSVAAGAAAPARRAA